MIFGLLVIKLIFSYLNVELGYWQSHLTPNVVKFNPLGLPKGFTRVMEYFMIPLLWLYMIKNLRYLGVLLIPVLITVGMLLMNVFTWLVNDVFFLQSFEYTLKLSAPIYFFICLVVHTRKHGFNLKKRTTQILWLCVGLTIVGILIFDPSYNHWRNWLPVYFAGMHTQTYLLAAVAMGFSFSMYINKKYIYMLIFLFLAFLFLYFGYQIRSSLVFFAVYLVTIVFVIHEIFQKVLFKVILLIPVLIVAFFILNSNFDWNKFSSGRVTMYEEKYEMLQTYTVKDYAFGRGKGSDFIYTRDWWYARKNSHNDILTFLIENGLPYTLLFFALFFSLMFFTGKVRLIYLSILIGYLFTSLLSNGIALRPIAGYVVFLVLAGVHCYSNGTLLPESAEDDQEIEPSTS